VEVIQDEALVLLGSEYQHGGEGEHRASILGSLLGITDLPPPPPSPQWRTPTSNGSRELVPPSSPLSGPRRASPPPHPPPPQAWALPGLTAQRVSVM
jgi:hypothetical protein